MKVDYENTAKILRGGTLYSLKMNPKYADPYSPPVQNTATTVASWDYSMTMNSPFAAMT